MPEMIELISTYGIGIVCVGYLIYFQNTTMTKMNDTLSKIGESLTIMNERIATIEDKITRYHE